MSEHIITSNIAEVATLPNRLTSCFQYLLPADLPNPNGRAFIDAVSGKHYTRSQLRHKALRLAKGLSKIVPTPKPSPPDEERPVVLVFSPNSIHYPLIFLALQANVLISSLANASYTPKELAHQLNDGKPSLIFVHPALLGIAREALKTINEDWTKKVKIYLTVPSVEVPKDGSCKGLKSFEELYVSDKELGNWQGENLDSKDGDTMTAALCYSSGTTGLAKGVKVTHRNITHVSTKANALIIPLDSNKDMVIGVLPYFHIYGLIKLVCYPLVVAVPNVTLPKFEPVLFLQTIEKYRITWALLVPPILVILANLPLVDEYDLSSLRSIMSGAAPLGEGLTLKTMERLKRGGKKGPGNPDIIITQGYGLTETTAPCSAVPGDWATRKIGSAGRLFPGLEVKLVDIDGNAIPIEFNRESLRSLPGEFCLRGTTVMRGYWKNEAATKGTFLEGGWYRTGDVAEIDTDGFFYIVDRLKELIKYKGFQVPPADLEALLLTHPDVDDVGVIGIMSEAQATELPRAYIVPRGGLAAWNDDKRKTLEKQIQNWIKERVASHKQLRGGVVCLEAIPKSAAGKILRRQLRDLAKTSPVATA